MDKVIDTHFDRLERALQNLIDSVSKYHPIIAQAAELDSADKALMLGIEQVQTHQANYIRLQTLRAASATLDTQIRSTISSLSTTRRDVATTATVKFPDTPPYPFSYSELLSYARRISKTTLPSSIGATLANPDFSPGAATTVDTPGADSTVPTPTTAGPGPSTINGTALPTPNQSGILGDGPAAATSFTGLPEDISTHINPLSNINFIPWPVEQQIRSGSLANTQMIINEGIDPAGYDPVAVEAEKKREAEEKAAQEEKERRQREERDRELREQREKMREQENRDNYRREAGMPTGQSSPVEKKQFHFFNLDDEDDDSE